MYKLGRLFNADYTRTAPIRSHKIIICAWMWTCVCVRTFEALQKQFKLRHSHSHRAANQIKSGWNKKWAEPRLFSIRKRMLTATKFYFVWFSVSQAHSWFRWSAVLCCVVHTGWIIIRMDGWFFFFSYISVCVCVCVDMDDWCKSANAQECKVRPGLKTKIIDNLKWATERERLGEREGER